MRWHATPNPGRVRHIFPDQMNAPFPLSRSSAAQTSTAQTFSANLRIVPAEHQPSARVNRPLPLPGQSCPGSFGA
jgi:hypothetical protein